MKIASSANIIAITATVWALLFVDVDAQFGFGGGSSTLDYTLIIGFPKPTVDAPPCTLEETARLEKHARDALIEAGETQRGNSEGLLSYNSGKKQDAAVLASALGDVDAIMAMATESSSLTLDEGELRTCDPDCKYWCSILNICTCCPHACCGGESDPTPEIEGGGGSSALRLRGVKKEDLPSKITKIRSKYMFLTAADVNIRCVDAMEAIVTVSAGYLPSETFEQSPWDPNMS